MDDMKNAGKPLIQLNNIVKSFSNNTVLRGVSLQLSQGEVMAIIGGNGAGKSTLMKILMGIYTADSGEIYINGEKSQFTSPLVALQKGIYYVPQEPMLFPNMTVEENILIGFNSNKLDLKKKLISLINKLDWNISLERAAETLSIAEQQLVEILRGLLREAHILILDEPTSALTFNEVESIFRLIKDLRSQGIGIFYITHRLTEVFDIATHVVILRDGTITLSGSVGEFTKDMLVQGLLPHNVNIKEEKPRKTYTDKINYTNTKPILETKNLTGYGFRNINLAVYPGEILGLAGVVGSGRTELAEAIFGIGEVISGKTFLNGDNITGISTKSIIRKGLNYIPEDRYSNGIFSIADVTSNITSSTIRWLSKFFIDSKKEREITEKYIHDFRIKVTGQNQILRFISGGNQQKVVIARALSTSPKAIILDEPTRGVDAGARGDVYKIIYSLKEQGQALLLISSDFEEIIELCDRVNIMYRGVINHSFKHEEITLDNLMSAAFGVYSEKEGV
jgi:AI-2 transport system ATP-binding protein